jgi:HSP20 family protein
MDAQTKGNVPVTTNKKIAKAKKHLELNIKPILDMEKAVERFLGRRWPSLIGWNDLPTEDSLFEFDGLRLPTLDVIDRDTEVLIRAEIPGIDKKDIHISLADNVLTIKGHTDHEKKEEKGDYYKHEISSSSYARSVTVPSNVDESKVAANLKDGILEIKLPKIESSKRRTIKVA